MTRALATILFALLAATACTTGLDSNTAATSGDDGAGEADDSERCRDKKGMKFTGGGGDKDDDDDDDKDHDDDDDDDNDHDDDDDDDCGDGDGSGSGDGSGGAPV